MILELAVNARADAIITANTQDFLPAAGTFGGEVIRPGEFLRRLHLLDRIKQAAGPVVKGDEL